MGGKKCLKYAALLLKGRNSCGCFCLGFLPDGNFRFLEDCNFATFLCSLMWFLSAASNCLSCSFGSRALHPQWPQCDHKWQSRANPILIKVSTFNRFHRAIRENNRSLRTAIGNAYCGKTRRRARAKFLFYHTLAPSPLPLSRDE